MDGPSHYREAERLLLDCQILTATENEPATYPAVEDGKNTICNALAAAQVHATLALAAATALANSHEHYEIAVDPGAADQRLDHLAGHALTGNHLAQDGGAA